MITQKCSYMQAGYLLLIPLTLSPPSLTDSTHQKPVRLKTCSLKCSTTWWRHQMETFSALLAICTGNSPVPGEFHAQTPVTRSFDVFFDLALNKRSKQTWGWWFETLSRQLWRHHNDKFSCWWYEPPCRSGASEAKWIKYGQIYTTSFGTHSITRKRKAQQNHMDSIW